VRREAAAALGHYKSDELDSLWLRHLDDEDAEVRSLALTALVRTGRSDLARRILAQSLDSPVFEGLPLIEKRRRFVAVSKLGGEQALNWFADLLRPHKRWFASRKTQEIEQAAAHGLRTIGSEAARGLLRQLAASGDRWVRAACQAELEG
jgi:HEAT repeat protein